MYDKRVLPKIDVYTCSTQNRYVYTCPYVWQAFCVEMLKRDNFVLYNLSYKCITISLFSQYMNDNFMILTILSYTWTCIHVCKITVTQWFRIWTEEGLIRSRFYLRRRQNNGIVIHVDMYTHIYVYTYAHACMNLRVVYIHIYMCTCMHMDV